MTAAVLSEEERSTAFFFFVFAGHGSTAIVHLNGVNI